MEYPDYQLYMNHFIFLQRLKYDTMADNKKDLHCDMIYKGDKPFKRSARTKQSTFEQLFDLLEANYKGAKFQKWVEYLKERYPF